MFNRCHRTGTRLGHSCLILDDTNKVCARVRHGKMIANARTIMVRATHWGRSTGQPSPLGPPSLGGVFKGNQFKENKGQVLSVREQTSIHFLQIESGLGTRGWIPSGRCSQAGRYPVTALCRGSLSTVFTPQKPFWRMQLSRSNAYCSGGSS